MRLWSLHPQYLDAKGLVALWREGLLAKKVLAGQTKGYRNHPQLLRFKKLNDPLKAIDSYLYQVWLEAKRRSYNFDKSKIAYLKPLTLFTTTKGQLLYEWKHLLKKLSIRDEGLYLKWKGLKFPLPFPGVNIVPGAIEEWEKMRD